MDGKVILFFFVTLILTGCNVVSDNESSSAYPLLVEKLSTEELQKLIVEYQEANPGSCLNLNSYGYNEQGICHQREILRVEIMENEQTRMEEMVKQFLVKNSKFTNIKDADLLEIESSNGREGCIKCDGSEGDTKTIFWEVRFKNQMLNGIEVNRSTVRVFMDAEKVTRVMGFWIEDMIAPEEDRMISFEEAKKAILGEEITYSDYTGIHTWVINEDSFHDFKDEKIVKHETPEGIEIRECWVVYAGYWHFFVDKIDGEVVKNEQIVVF